MPRSSGEPAWVNNGNDLEIPTVNETDWAAVWGSNHGEYNSALGTYDVGLLTPENFLPNASGVIRVASSVSAPYLIRESFSRVANGTLQQKDLWGGSLVLALEGICADLKLRCQLKAMEPSATDSDDGISATFSAILEKGYRIGLSTAPSDGSRLGSEKLEVVQFPGQKVYSILIHQSHIWHDVSSVSSLVGGLFDVWSWAFLGLAFLLCLCTFSSLSYLDESRRKQRQRRSLVGEIVWLGFYRMVTSEYDGTFLPYTRKFRAVLFLSWSVSSLIVSTAIQSTLPPLLSVPPRSVLPFKDLNGLLESNYEIIATKPFLQSVAVYNDSQAVQLTKRCQIFTGSRKKWFQEVLTTAKQERVFIAHEERVQELAEFTCDLVIAFPAFRSISLGGFWFIRGDPLVKPFAETLHWLMATGLADIDTQYYRWYSSLARRRKDKKFDKCLSKPVTVKRVPQKKALGLSDLAFLFDLLLGSVAVTVLVMLCERLRLLGLNPCHGLLPINQKHPLSSIT